MSKHKIDQNGSVQKPEKKRRKKDRTNGLRLEDITPSSTDVTASSSPRPEGAAIRAHEPHTDSSVSSKVDRDTFCKSNAIRIADPQDLQGESAITNPIQSFSDLPVEVHAQFAPQLSSFQKPSIIQSCAWPFLLSGRDVVGVAETGSGKTIAFGLPLVIQLSKLEKKKGIRAVCVTPTRELAIQVFEEVVKLCKTESKLKAVCIYGGTNKDEQRRTLTGANVLVATPGRLKDFMAEGSVNLSKTRYLVLDEADRMLDKGFEDDIKQIISEMPSSSKRQTAMFTATWPKSIRELAATFMNQPVMITVGRNEFEDSGELRANPRIKQKVEVIDGFMKQQRLLQLLNEYNRGKRSNDRILVFCLYKKEAMRIETFIRNNGYHVAGIHGDMSQHARVASLESFKSGSVSLLVATDVAARGLDIPEVKLVINVTFPLTAEDYVHRIGRTGRAGKDGLAITFFTEQDKPLAGALVNVLKAANQMVSEDLLKFGTTVKKKQHESYGAFFRESDGAKSATKITFDD